MASSRLPVPAAERTLRLLEILQAHPAGLSPQEMMAALGVSRSSLFALLTTLKRLGYVEQAEQRGRYRPGPRLQAWRSATPAPSQDLLLAFYQEATASLLDETLALAVVSGEEVLILAQVESPHRVRSVFEPGQRCALETSAAGQVLQLAPPERVRLHGYALHDDGETVELALPICPDGHRPEAALVLSAPRFRHTAEGLRDHLPRLREMAARLSYRLGALEYRPYRSDPLPALSPAVPLDEGEIAAFLQGPWVARLACVRPDGTPHVVPVWHEWDGQVFHVVAWQGSHWAEYLLQDPRVSLTVDEAWPPLRRVSVRGRAEPLQPGAVPGGLPALLNRLSRRYLGRPLRPHLPPQAWRAFRIVPEHLRGWRGLPARIAP